MSAILGRCSVVIVALTLWPQLSAAQETRASVARQQRAAKAATLHPYEPTQVEATLFRIEDRYLMERIFNPPRGVFVRFGGLPPGAGLAAGPAYRHSNHTLSLTGSSAISFRGYWELNGTLAFPHLAGDRAFVHLGVRRRSLPQEDFFGLGSDTRSSAQTSFALRETSFAAEAGASPVDWFHIAGSVGHEQPRVSAGKDGRFPSIDESFDDAAAPGLLLQPDFVRAGGRATFDLTDRPLGPPTGGTYSVSYDAYHDRDLDRYSFRQWSVDFRQYVPIVTGARTIVLRAFATGVTPDAGHEVPFYYQPTLGGAYSLRMLPEYRLRDRHVLLLQAEYRFELNAFMTGAVFYDAGKVAHRRQDLGFRGLRHDAGFGLRLGFMSNVSLRTEVAFGSDGPRLIFKFNDVF
jgi:hypothetical protein